MKLPDLGLNIDHIATLRQARRIHQPDPLEAVFIAKNAGAEQITLHLREDRRHIHEDDVARIITSSPLPVNVECASDLSKGGVVEILCALRPHKITLVPEKREEITTEGGLNMRSSTLAETIERFKHHNIPAAVFIEPDREAIHLAKELEVDGIELHTGVYAHCSTIFSHFCLPHSHNTTQSPQTRQLALQITQTLQALESAATLAHSLGLEVFAGHGLNYENIAPIPCSPIY